MPLREKQAISKLRIQKRKEILSLISFGQWLPLDLHISRRHHRETTKANKEKECHLQLLCVGFCDGCTETFSMPLEEDLQDIIPIVDLGNF